MKNATNEKVRVYTCKKLCPQLEAGGVGVCVWEEKSIKGGQRKVVWVNKVEIREFKCWKQYTERG